MAPYKKIRTYQKFHISLTKTERAFNDLMAKNLIKRYESSWEQSVEKSESTFDRLLKSENYNGVAFRKFPQNRFNESIQSDDELKGSSSSSTLNNKHSESSENKESEKDSKRKFDPIKTSSIVTRSKYKSGKGLPFNFSDSDPFKEVPYISNKANRNNCILIEDSTCYRIPEDQTPSQLELSRHNDKDCNMSPKNIKPQRISCASSNYDTVNCKQCSPDFKGFSSEQNESKKIHSNYMTISQDIESTGLELHSKMKNWSAIEKSKNGIKTCTPISRRSRIYKYVASTPKANFKLNDDKNSSCVHIQNVQCLISSTPLQAEKKLISTSNSFQSIVEDKENYSPIRRSYETIKLWNYKCPSPNSFVIKKNMKHTKFRTIVKRKRSKNSFKKNDIKLKTKTRVIVERIPQLDKLLEMKKNRSSLSTRSLLLKLNRSRSNLSNTTQRTKSKNNRTKKKFSLRSPIVLLTPLKNNSIVHSKKTKETDHICSTECECFKKQPIVILPRFDCFMRHDLIRNSDDEISIIDISDSEIESDVFIVESSDNSDLEKSSISENPEENRCIDTSYRPNHENCTNVDNSNNSIANYSKEIENLNNSNTNRNSSIEPILTLKDCHVSLQGTQNKSTDSCNAPCVQSTRASGSNSRLEDCSDVDIIESSISSSCRKKFISLAPGKKFRRSRVIWKLARESLNISESKSVNDRCQLESIRLSRRISVKLLPVREEAGKLSDLKLYASQNAGYGYASGQESTLDFENQLQSLFSTSNQPVHGIDKNYTARDIVLRKCGQTEPLNFEKCYPSSILQNCQKIGEGVFGEVFMFREKDGSLTVMKIIPIEGDQMVNMEKQKTFAEIISEIVISTELSSLRTKKRNYTDSFTEVKKIRCVQGCYPDRLIYLWELYDENKKSENDSPEIFSENQLFIILELSNGGRDLEAFEFSNGQQSLAVFKQVAAALAVAENEFRFEHRDLHWGNVLVTPIREKKCVYVLDGKEIIVDNKGVKATIIDFTLSRMEHEGVIIYNDLAMDEDLFTAKGDYQFDIYRLMQKHNDNVWQDFKPYTNILWLHYMLDKTITSLRYKNVKSKLHREAISSLKLFKNEILQYDSASDFVENYLIK